MTTTLSRLLLLGASAAALSACTSVDLASLPQPKYATRIEDLVPGPSAPPPTPARTAQVTPVPQPGPEPVEAPGPTVRAAPSGRVTAETLPPPAPSADQSSAEPEQPAPPPPAPKPVSKATVTPAASRPAAPSASGMRYTVQPGDTLSGVGRRFAVPTRTLIELNGLPPEGGIRSGQKLKLPPEAKDRGTDPYASGPVTGEPAQRVAEAAPAKPASTPPKREPAPVVAEAAPVKAESGSKPAESGRPSTVKTEAPAPAAPAAPPVQTAPIIASAPPADLADLARAVRGRFLWPVKGEILSRYGALGQGLRNDGVNIGAPAGTAVKAADAGEVVYAGDSVPGFGNLVLIKHADGWVTAYGHLGRIDVKMRQQVARGTAIGQVGQTGGVDRPQLHFEMRYAASPAEKARPLDPLPLLQ